MQNSVARGRSGNFQQHAGGVAYGEEVNGTTYYPAPPVATHFCIDVECIAFGEGHLDRMPAQVALVDQFEQVLMNQYIQPSKPVRSYLTPLTGVTEEQVAGGLPLDAALAALRSVLPPGAVLVGQNVMQDVNWLGLREGADFQSVIDLAGLFRVWNPTYNTFSVFSQDHVAKVLLNWPSAAGGGGHNAASDALKSIRLYNTYLRLSQSPPELAEAQQALLAAPVEPSFKKQSPYYEGVCMGNRKACQCKQPHFL